MSEVDKFLDGYGKTEPAGAKAPAASSVDELMKSAPAQDKGMGGFVRDAALSLAKGVVAVPEAAVGLADMATGGRAGKALENTDGDVGFRPKQAKEFLGDLHTEKYKDQQAQFQQADGVIDKTMVALSNPSLIANPVVESLPAMGAGGAMGRAGLAAGRGMGAIATPATAAQAARQAGLAGAAGEGLSMAGSQAEAIRQETPDGLLTPMQVGAAALTGVIGTAVGAGSARLARYLGIGDADTMLAQGARGVTKQMADDAASAAVNAVAKPTIKSIPRKVLEGAITEGFLEELPQSMAETVLQNLALGKPWHEKLDEAAVMGVLTGGAMGGGAAGIHGMMEPSAPAAPAVPAKGMGAVASSEAPGGMTLAPMGGDLPAEGGGLLPQDEPSAMSSVQRSFNPRDPNSAPPLALLPKADAEGLTFDAPPVQTPSQAMGLDPEAGSMSAAAALAVDSGATDQMAKFAQAQVEAEKKGEGAKAGTLEAAAQGGALQPLPPQAGPAVDEDGVILDAPSTSAPSVYPTYEEAQAYVMGQRRNGASVTGLPVPAEGGGFTLAMKGTPQYQQGVELRAQRMQAEQAAKSAAAAAVPPVAPVAPATEPAAVAAPAPAPSTANLKSITAKQIPAMTDSELQAAIQHYGPEHKRTAKLQKEVQRRAAEEAPTSPIQGTLDVAQTEQATAQPAPVAPEVGALTDGAPTANTGAQGPAAGAAQATAPAEDRAAKAKRIDGAGERWQRMTTVERKALADRTDIKPILKKNLPGAMWKDLNIDLKGKLADLMEPPASVPAQPVGDEKRFALETGTLGVPRADMPQVPTASHGGLVKHLNAQGIAHETTTVNAADLKPTQAEYSPSKVEQAKSATGGRSVIVSNDGHIIDGHHQAMAASEEGKTVKAIVLDAPVEQALEAVKNSPSAAQQTEAPSPREADNEGNAQSADAPTEEPNNADTEPSGNPADQGRAPEVSGRRTDAAQPDDASADSGNVEAGQSQDVPAIADAGRAGGDGLRKPATDVGGKRPSGEGGDTANGRAGTGRTRAPDAGARSRSQVKAPEEVSPANPGPGNFHIENPLEIVGGGQVARFDKNQAAIDLLNAIREDSRQATAEEQRTLAGYTGWGSFGQELFQGTWEKPMPKDGWQARDKWLREHLGEDEWKSAQRSITNAHYTDPPTVMAMWDMAKRMGFTGGRVLEPSMGIGNFFGMMPADIKARSRLAGIELDSLTGSMAKLLYPDANVKVMGYQESKTPDDFHDVVIGNWPFENTVIADRRYNGLSPFLHDYFFLKAVDQVRPGGLVIGITSNGTMDKKATRIRAALAKKAELVSAIRLPSGAFQEYAGTKVVTDIVILRKREQPLSQVPSDPWLNSVAYKTPAGPEVFINEYYVANPGNVIGTTDFGHGTTRMQPGMIVHRPENMAERLRAAVELVPEGAYKKAERTKHITYITNHTADREGALTVQDGQLMVVRGEHLAPADDVIRYKLKSATATAQREKELRSLIDMRGKYAALIEADRGGADATAQRTALREAYEAFTAEHGPLGDSFGLTYLKRIDDPFRPALAALDVNGRPSAILTGSTMRGAAKMQNPTAQDAYVLARNRAVEPTIEEIAALAKRPVGEVRAALLESGAVFETPAGAIVPSDIYLSGNVREKLRQAQAALADGNAAMQRNVDELAKVVPKDIPYFNIESQLGATWVPPKTYAAYVAHMLNMPDGDAIGVTFVSGRWKVKLPEGANRRAEASTGFGTSEYPFSKLVNAAMSNQTVRIRRKDSEGNEYLDTEATDEANGKIADMRGKFGEWLWSDPERRVALEREYNEVRNAYATPKYDGSFLAFEGMALSLGRGPFNLREHQVNAIWRALVNRRSLNGHEVGTGKTFTMGGIAVESRRYGIAKKPVLLAHNANSASVAAEIQQMYPGAKVLYIDNLSPDTIAVKMRQIANDDWDAIVLPHSLIDRLSFREETLMAMAQEDITSLEEEAYAAAEDDGVTITSKMLEDDEELKKLRSVTAKELVKARNRIIETIKEQAMRSSKEGAIPFEELGIDMVLVDEVHEFKKPPISTRMNMKGLNTQTSNRSIALQFITRYIRANNNGGNVHTFTGTPITNTLTEIFHQMRYVMEDEMKAAGVDTWDGWFGSFAKEVQDVELSAAGEYEAVTRLAGFINVPELRRMIGQYMDVVFADDMPEMQPRQVNGMTMASADLTEAERAELLNGRTEGATDRPYKKVVNVTSDLTAEQKAIFARLQGYARRWRSMTGKERKEAMASGAPESPIITEGMANKASFDVRLTRDDEFAGQEGTAPDDPGSKASKVIANVLEVYRSSDQATQVIFAEQGYSTSQKRSAGRDVSGKKVYRTVRTFSTMRDIVERLVDQGIPREQIAMVDGSTSKEKRKEIADAMNALRIRVVIGSTDTLGVGVNMQRNLRAMHHMDAPYMPGELEQRNGRGLRQGNQWNTVMEYRYMTDRLDGRRWQILAIKQRFITAFLKSNSSTRVIEGDAAADEDNDILQSFSEAAGDPRILIREKLSKNVEALKRAERLHTNGVADAIQGIRRQNDSIAWAKKRLADMTADNLPAKVRDMLQAQATNYRATVGKAVYDSRAEAEEAMQQHLQDNIRMEASNVFVGTYAGQPVMAWWPPLQSAPHLTITMGNQEFVSGSLRGLESQLRGLPARIEKVQQEIASKSGSIGRLQEVSTAPFARAADLERAKKQFDALVADIAANPVPPPAWLRAGAPVESAAYRNGKEFLVTGHRWNADGWFVLAQDAKGEMVIPYAEVTDAQGMPVYEPREFEAPEVHTREAKSAPGIGEGDAPGAASAARTATPADRAIMDMVREGQAASGILRLVAGTSRSRFNRQVARLLMRAGVNPAVRLEQADLGGGDGFTFLAKYSRKHDVITMTPGAVNQAEHIFMHEMVHAATLRALDRKGLASLQMRRLYEHVRSQGGAAGHYGMKNVGEFVAEAFTNPEFQQALRGIRAPAGSVLQSAWDGFVRILRSILGLQQDAQDALSQALELGVAVVREDMRVRQRQPARAGGDAFMGGDAGNVQPVVLTLQGWSGNASALSTLAREVYSRELQGTTVHNASLGADVAFSSEGKGEAFGARGKLRNPIRAEMVSVLRELVGNAVKVAEAAPAKGRAADSKAFHTLVAPLSVNGELHAVRITVREALLVPEGQAAHKFYDVTSVQIERSPGVHGFDDGASTTSRPAPSEASAISVAELARALKIEGFESDGDAFFGTADLGRIKSGALAQINAAVSHPGKLNWWHKTIGTMYNLAERSPEFKPVFEAAQGFVDDVSHYATDAAELAPRLLPKLEEWRDITKSPVSAADNKAVAKPVFEGTLAWARDDNGEPVRVADLEAQALAMTVDEKAQHLLDRGEIDPGMLRAWQGMPASSYESAITTRYQSRILAAGVVWTDGELRSLFQLTDGQIALYKEFRAATDRSLDTMGRADMLRYGGEDVKPLRAMVMDAADIADAERLLRRHLTDLAKEKPDRAEQIAALLTGIEDRAAKVAELQGKGYAPLSRFGKYTVDVVVNGERQYFSLFETAAEANDMAVKMRAEFGDSNVTQGTISDEAFKLFAGITPESLEIFGNMLGLDSEGDQAQDKAFQEYLRLTKTNRSAMKRLIHRKGIAGYSEDVGRVLASFVYSNSRQTAAGLHMGDLGQAVSEIPQGMGELKDAAVRLAEYVKNPQEEAQAVRGLLFAQYLGGSIASAFVNMSQPVAVTFPWLSQFGGARQAAAELARAAKNIATRDFVFDKDLAASLKAAEDDGTVSPQEVHQLMAQASGRGSLRSGDGTRLGDARAAGQNALARLSVAWGKVFGVAEQLNRRMTFIAAYRVAVAQGMPNPHGFAKRAVTETQFLYSKANKMRFARGAIGGTLMTFKTYSVAYLELLHRMYTQGGPEGKKAALLALGMLMLMGGAGGLPFMEDAEDVADALAQMLGYNFSSKQARQQLLEEMLPKGIADFIDKGVSGLPGAPLDVSGRLGMGNLIPGTGVLLEKTSHTRDVMEIAGPMGDFATRILSGTRKVLTGDVAGGVLEVSPTAVRNAAKGVDMAATGMYRDARGYKVLDTNTLEAALKSIGFQPASVATVQEANGRNQQAKNFYNLQAQQIRAKWAAGVFENDQAMVSEARQDIADWNRRNPDQPMLITVPSVMSRVREMRKSKDQRIADSAPRAMRAQMREELLTAR